jgi:hypothetical protein
VSEDLTLVEFLRQRLDEDEWAAREMQRIDGPSHIGIVVARYGQPYYRCLDGKRMLAEVAAKRAILDAYAGIDDRLAYVRIGDWESCSDSCAGEVLDRVLRLLAGPYAAQPGFKDEWRVA